jgi:hypothetical protein
MMYEWEPWEETYYVYGTQPGRTTGMFYDALHVEQTVEGWHGIILGFVPSSEFGDDYDSEGFAMLDEKVFHSQGMAMGWCELRDGEAYEAQVGPEALATEEAIWNAILEDGEDDDDY